MRGRLIAFEGVDASGKTTLAKSVCQTIESTVCVKGQGNKETVVGRFARRHPSTFVFLFELLVMYLTFVRSALKNGKTIIHDRYYYSIMAFPTALRWYNQLFFKLFQIVLPKPDLVVYTFADTDEIIRRLKALSGDNRFHEMLINDPWILDYEREIFMKMLSNAKRVMFFDTTKRSVKQLTEAVIVAIKDLK